MENQNYTTEQRCAALAALENVLSNPGHRSGAVIRDTEGLDEENISILLELGSLRELLNGWYFVCFTKEDGDPTDWYRAYWPFIVAYLDTLYPGSWCLSPECSLHYYSGYTIIPEELVIRSEFAEGRIRQLPFDTCIVEIRGDAPEDVVTEDRFGVRLFPLHTALLKVPEEFFDKCHVEARTCLAMLTDPEELIKAAGEEYLPKRALRLAKELRNFGRTEMADSIKEAVAEFTKGAERIYFPQNDRPLRMTQTGPLGNRIRLMWRQMRTDVLLWKEYEKCKEGSRPAREIILRLQETLEYERPEIVVLKGLGTDMPEINRDYKGPDEEIPEAAQELYRGMGTDLELEHGFRKAFKRVARDILDSLTGGQRIANLAAHHYADWNYVLFEPGVKAGLFKAPDLSYDRMTWEDPCIVGSRHVPFDPNELEDAVHALSEAFQREDDPFVRAVLGHFFLIYIQPFTAGNIQTAWLLMNSQLVAAGYPWIVLPDYYVEEYKTALREAAELEHVERLVVVVARLIRASWKTDLRKLAGNTEYLENGITGQ